MILIFLLFHLPILALAAWLAFNRRAWLQVPAMLTIASEVVGFWLAASIRTNGFIALEIMWWIQGPFFLPLMVLQAAAEAPLWVLPPVAIGLLVGAGTWLALWKRRQLRVMALVAVLASGLATWISAEATVETTMRLQARQIRGSCDIYRRSTPAMFVNGLSYPARHSHGFMRDGSSMYAWKFSAGGWVKTFQCPPLPPGATWPSPCTCLANRRPVEHRETNLKTPRLTSSPS